MRYWDQCWWSSCGSPFAHVRIALRYAACGSLDHTSLWGPPRAIPLRRFLRAIGDGKAVHRTCSPRPRLADCLSHVSLGIMNAHPNYYRSRGRAGVAGVYNQSSRRAGQAHSTGVERIKSRFIFPLYSGGFCASVRLSGHRVDGAGRGHRRSGGGGAGETPSCTWRRCAGPIEK
mgnify:CR=1 FL=1